MGARDMLDRDPGEVNEGDECPTEVRRDVPRVWHNSQAPAVMPAASVGPCESGRAELARIKAMAGPVPKREGRAPVHVPSWRDTPELFRRMVAHAAGLDRDVVAKLDRDLSEAEKAKLRQAARELRDASAALVAL
jgi:hypothetical protein